jgi:hypothetical protein
MANFVETVSSAGGRHVNLYSGISAEEISKLIDSYFLSSGYVKKETGPNSVTYTKGSRFMRLMFGAFCKYFKFIVSVRPVDDSTVEVSVTKDSSGMSGGAIGMSQVKNEFDRIKKGLSGL